MIVKHSEAYESENEDRLQDVEESQHRQPDPILVAWCSPLLIGAISRRQVTSGSRFHHAVVARATDLRWRSQAVACRDDEGPPGHHLSVVIPRCGDGPAWERY